MDFITVLFSCIMGALAIGGTILCIFVFSCVVLNELSDHDISIGRILKKIRHRSWED